MATYRALVKAKRKLVTPRAWQTSEPVRHAVLRLNLLIDVAFAARDEDIAKRGAVAVTTPWRVGDWQEGERYEYEPRIPIYDDAGDEIFEVTADDKPTDARSIKALALANEIVKAVNALESVSTTINIADSNRKCAAAYSTIKPLTPDGARELARKLVACADAIERASR